MKVLLYFPGLIKNGHIKIDEVTLPLKYLVNSQILTSKLVLQSSSYCAFDHGVVFVTLFNKWVTESANIPAS